MHDNANKLLIDWLSITTKALSAQALVDFLGMSSCPWENGKGFHGYRSRLYYDSISIHTDGTTAMGIWLEMSGQGCRAFESYGTGDYQSLFRLVLEQPKEYNITRLDVAFDDFTGILEARRIYDDTVNQKYKSKAEAWSATISSDGISMNIGSPKSKVLIRIYDKLAERLSKIQDQTQKENIRDDIQHWIRVELQMRDERAFEFLKHLSALPIGETFSGVLSNYLSYGYSVPAKNNPDKSVWHTFPYWQEIIGNAAAISIYSNVGTEYNLNRCKNYVFNMAGNAVDALLKIQGVEDFMNELKQRYIKPNPKYIQLVEESKETKN